MKQILSLLAVFFSCTSVAIALNEKATVSPLFTLNVGKQDAFEFKSPKGNISAVFEDDGDAGFFYALDYSDKSQPIQEAMHIYNVKAVTDKNKPSVVRIVWSADGTKAGLWINDYPHAVFDFAARQGYCRSNFPSPAKWKNHDFLWSDNVLKYFQ
jgi:hypothetical protein